MTSEKLAILLGLAIALGAGVKHLIPQIENRFIPAITFVFFLVGGLWGSGWDTSFDNVLQLLVMALGPTGLHQLATRTAEKPTNGSENQSSGGNSAS